MGKIRLLECNELKNVIKRIAVEAGFEYIDFSRIGFVVSFSSTARAYARVYGLPRQIQVAHNLPPLYTIEFICNNMFKLDCQAKLRVLLHELLHIPYRQAGGLRQHGKIVNDRNARKHCALVSPQLREEFCRILDKCCNKVQSLTPRRR